jgi:hypothetical protein
MAGILQPREKKAGRNMAKTLENDEMAVSLPGNKGFGVQRSRLYGGSSLL